VTTQPIERLPTGIPGLDRVLEGGVLRGGIYIVQGAPGAGKTIFGNQLCFSHIAMGGRALYVTLLAESHSRMLGHIGRLSYFDGTVIPDKLSYLSAFRMLEEEGLRGLLDTLRREIQNRRADLVILDGFVSAEETASSPRELKKFVHELQIQAGLTDCTMFLLTSAYVGQRFVAAEHTMVDGLIELESRLHGRRAERSLQVHKFRGGASLRGRHSFRITDDGIIVYPRTEARLAQPSGGDTADGPKVSLGIAGLDAMMGGGPSCHSKTLVMGPAGSGKTTIGLQFLGAADEPGLFLSFSESPAALRWKASLLNLPVGRLIDSGQVEILWHPTTEGVLDELCQTLIETVRVRKVSRLVIDGVDGFDKLTDEKDRLPAVLTALSNELRALGVTTISTGEMDLAGIVPGQPLAGLSIRNLSPISDNIIVLRLAAQHSAIHRLIAVLKARESRIDLKFRLFDIGENGIAIDADLTRAETVLSEITRQGAFGLASMATLPTELGRGD
jgi:circadian clock protein KaiC